MKSRQSVKWFCWHFKVKVRICLDNRDWDALAGKCINNRTRGRSQKEAELIAYCFRRKHLCGSKLHAGYSIPLRFYLEGALFGDDVEKFVSGLIITGTSIWQVGRLLRRGLGAVSAIMYHCNVVSVILTKSNRKLWSRSFTKCVSERGISDRVSRYYGAWRSSIVFSGRCRTCYYAVLYVTIW